MRRNALEMIYRRARAAGLATQIGCHTFRATGITIYLTNGGTLEKAQMMAAHESPRTTKLYDRTNDTVSLDEVERVVLWAKTADRHRRRQQEAISHSPRQRACSTAHPWL